MYPTYRQSKRVLFCGTRYITENLFPGISFLYVNLNEIHPESRFSEYNHVPHFVRYVTAIVETFPVSLFRQI